MVPDDLYNTFSILREFSEFQIKYPYLIYCKGNKEIMIRNVQRPNILFRLVIEDSFFCFANASFDPDLVRIENKAEKKVKNQEDFLSVALSKLKRKEKFLDLTPLSLRQHVEQIYDKVNQSESNSEKIYFISIKGKTSFINVLKLSPYTKGIENQMILHFKQKKGSE